MRLGQYKITKIDGDETIFHIIKGEIIPYSNFKLALEWYAGEQLAKESKTMMEKILEMKAALNVKVLEHS